MIETSVTLFERTVLIAAPNAHAASVSIWSAVAALGGVVAGAIVARLIAAASIRRTAAMIEGLAQRGGIESVLRDADTLPRSWSRVVHALRRTARSMDQRDQALAARLRDLEGILYSATTGFIAMDPQQRVLELNPAATELLGILVPSVRGRLLQEITRHAELNRFVTQAFEAAQSIEADCALQTAPQRQVHALSEPLRDRAGRTIGMLVSLQDVTRLRRLETLRSEFVANVSHELRTPITSIKGYVETLLQVGASDPAQVRKFLEIVHRNTTRLSSLVEDLLSLASLEQSEFSDDAHHVTLDAPAIDPNTIVDAVVELLSPAASDRGIRIDVTLTPKLEIAANRVLAEQALANLVANAIRYAPERSTIRIETRARDSSVVLSVRDEGPGIAPSHVERIFERFYRVDRARSSARGGTGLGLAIVKHIAQAHGGSVEVDSELGVGSTFRLLFPQPSVTPHAAPSTAPSAAPTAPKHVA